MHYCWKQTDTSMKGHTKMTHVQCQYSPKLNSDARDPSVHGDIYIRSTNSNRLKLNVFSEHRNLTACSIDVQQDHSGFTNIVNPWNLKASDQDTEYRESCEIYMISNALMSELCLKTNCVYGFDSIRHHFQKHPKIHVSDKCPTFI